MPHNNHEEVGASSSSFPISLEICNQEGMFDLGSRLKDDVCSLSLADKDNHNLCAYRLRYNVTKPGASKTTPQGNVCIGDNIPDLSCQRNLRVWTGYGVNCGVIDEESTLLREGTSSTRCGKRQQLNTRVFEAAPDLSRGRIMPDTESHLINGQDTTSIRECYKLTERAFDTFNPVVQSTCVENIIPNWTWGGASSRDIAKSESFLRGAGYEYDGRSWYRSSKERIAGCV